eukprot:GHVT01081651.1.p2 GENE.GHVT01081651.1~~GHVT01081651.1.p2  ORF type:complete len:104 (+),score=35.71 GHVT01081651.1:300-611(+)
MFLRFFPEEVDAAQTFAERLAGVEMSMAELQNFFLFCKNDAQQALEMAAHWREADGARRGRAPSQRATAAVEAPTPLAPGTAATGPATAAEDKTSAHRRLAEA